MQFEEVRASNLVKEVIELGLGVLVARVGGRGGGGRADLRMELLELSDCLRYILLQDWVVALDKAVSRSGIDAYPARGWHVEGTCFAVSLADWMSSGTSVLSARRASSVRG
jgi:hypothetical protein